MSDKKCPECGCTEIWDEDCDECNGRQQLEDGSDCPSCEGTGYAEEIQECSACGIMDQACAFDDVVDA